MAQWRARGLRLYRRHQQRRTGSEGSAARNAAAKSACRKRGESAVRPAGCLGAGNLKDRMHEARQHRRHSAQPEGAVWLLRADVVRADDVLNCSSSRIGKWAPRVPSQRAPRVSSTRGSTGGQHRPLLDGGEPSIVRLGAEAPRSVRLPHEHDRGGVIDVRQHDSTLAERGIGCVPVSMHSPNAGPLSGSRPCGRPVSTLGDRPWSV